MILIVYHECQLHVASTFQPTFRSWSSLSSWTAGFESLTEELQNIRMEITVIANKIRADAEVAKIESEWKFAAMVNNAI